MHGIFKYKGDLKYGKIDVYSAFGSRLRFNDVTDMWIEAIYNCIKVFIKQILIKCRAEQS